MMIPENNHRELKEPLLFPGVLPPNVIIREQKVKYVFFLPACLAGKTN